MRQLKIGSNGSEVAALQNKLGLKADGMFGPNTEKAVERFQLDKNLAVSGIVDNDMWSLILNLEYAIPSEIDEDTDIYSQYYTTNYDQIIHKHFLPKKEYVEGLVKNEYVFNAELFSA